MPATYIHEYTALMAMNRQPCEAAPAALCLGSYGPDALFYHDPLSFGRQVNLGKYLHVYRTCEFLTELVKACTPSPAARDYARGFLCHYAADTVFHPFVYALSMTRAGYSTLRHIAAERALDAWLIKLTGPRRSRELPEAERIDIARSFCAAVARWDNHYSLTLSDMLQTIKRCRGVGSMMSLLGGHSVQLHVQGSSGRTDISPEQLQAFALQGWVHPWTGIRFHDGPFELLGEAIKRGARFIACANMYWHGECALKTLSELLGDKSYLSGIGWRVSREIPPVELTRLRAVKKAFRRA